MNSMILKIMLLYYLAQCQGQETSTSQTEPSSSLSSSTSSPTPPVAVTPNTTIDYSAVYEAHAIEPLEIATKRMQHIHTLRRDYFRALTTKRNNFNDMDKVPAKREIDNDYHDLVYDLAANLSVIPVRHLRNATLRRQVQRLSKLQLHGLNRRDYRKAQVLMHTIQSFLTSPIVCANDCKNAAPKAMEPTILKIVETTKNKNNDLLTYWLKWRQALDKDYLAKSTFMEYVELWRKAAAYNGHVTPSRTWYLKYDSENFQRELEDIVWEIMPLYQELHAYLRHWARMKYGERLTDANDGAIPAPVMEQILLQDWYPNPVFRTPYPNHQLPTVKQRLEEVLESPLQINKKSSDFFESLGLNKLSKQFNEKFVRRINDDVKHCKPEVHYFPPDVALRFCNRIDFRGFLQMHSYMAELQYNMYKRELPFGLDHEPCPGFGSALGEAAVIAAGTPRHLYRLHIVPNESLTPEQSLNRLFRLGIHTLLAIPQYFINDKYLVDVMDRRISPPDYNCGYWKLQYKYAGVVPPTRRGEKHFDPGYKFYKGLDPEKPNTVKFISEVLGFQFYRSLCLISGEYKPGDPDNPLYNCDFSESTAAGSKIKEMMKMGSTKHWREVMKVATDEDRLSAKGLMEYFAPLYIWLKEENKKLGLIPGWDDDIKCGNTF